MKRHEALQPLSRFHRSILFLALVAKKNAPEVKGYPNDHEGKVDYSLSFYQRKLIPHFRLEEKGLFSIVSQKDSGLKRLVNELLAEREALESLFDQLAQSREVSTLDEIGVLLEAHVRKEERQLFQQIQDVCGEEFLSRLSF